MSEVTQSLVRVEAAGVATVSQPEAMMRRNKEMCQINTRLLDRAVEGQKWRIRDVHISVSPVVDLGVSHH